MRLVLVVGSLVSSLVEAWMECIRCGVNCTRDSLYSKVGKFLCIGQYRHLLLQQDQAPIPVLPGLHMPSFPVYIYLSGGWLHLSLGALIRG